MGMYHGVILENGPMRDADIPHLVVETENKEPSRTLQEFADECDINAIMARYEKTGVVNHYNTKQPRYLDLTDVPDFQASLNLLRVADEAFASLPANVRKTFDNDPAKFVEFAQDEKNLDQMREWGLAKPLEAPPAPMKVYVEGGTLDPAEAPEEAPVPSKRSKKSAD